VSCVISVANTPFVSDEELRLFQEAVADARPLESDRVHHEPPRPLPIPRQRERDERAALAESIASPDPLDLHLEGGDEAAWLRPGMSPNVLRDLRRGRWVVQEHVDLHGMNRDEARHQVALFLVECLQRGARCVRIVHGKGLGSPRREPVLKKLVQGWLSQRQEVLAFCQARAAEGGSGAVIVLLRGR
jgi:DNA-nicking Smr family endonuclease